MGVTAVGVYRGLRRDVSRARPWTQVNDGGRKLNPYVCRSDICTIRSVDVSVTNLRAHLSDWLDRVQHGEDVVITDRGTPVAKIVRVTASELLDDLEREGLLARPTSQARPRAGDYRRVRATRSVAKLVSSQRD